MKLYEIGWVPFHVPIEPETVLPTVALRTAMAGLAVFDGEQRMQRPAR